RKRVGIVGLGGIGLRVAKRFKAFGCIISYNSRHVKSQVPYTYYANVGKMGIIVNVARGAVIDEKELPHVPNEMITLDNVILSPHKAVFTPDSFDALEKVVIGNIRAFFSDKPLLTEIELD
ncbi:glyoxylate/hydroxypyruvate reductase hpr3, partial [Phtheirospermum japonicum]